MSGIAVKFFGGPYDDELRWLDDELNYIIVSANSSVLNKTVNITEYFYKIIKDGQQPYRAEVISSYIARTMPGMGSI